MNPTSMTPDMVDDVLVSRYTFDTVTTGLEGYVYYVTFMSDHCVTRHHLPPRRLGKYRVGGEMDVV